MGGSLDKEEMTSQQRMLRTTIEKDMSEKHEGLEKEGEKRKDVGVRD